MKKIYTMAAGFLLCAGLVSCEMKEELFGEGTVPEETGFVTLGVSVDDKTNVVITRAAATDEGAGEGSSVDPSDFPVVFSLQSAEYTQEYTYGDIAGTPVKLPVGKYTVTSHTPGELKGQMSSPYYSGDAELTVSENVQAKDTITCTMQNTRILLSTENLTSNFTSWTITINDGSSDSGNILVFTNEDGTNPAAVYWLVRENCSAITVNFTGTTTDGKQITETRMITKPDGAADMNWIGGDALTITMKPGTTPDPENPTGVSGIEITVEAFFETEKNESVEVPIEGEEVTPPTDPDEGTDEGGEDEGGETTGAPSIKSNYLTSGISFSITQNPDWQESDGLMTKYTVNDDAPATANVTISAPKGFKSITVRIDATGDFAAAAGLMGLTSDVDILSPNLDESLKSILNPPTSSETSYTLDVAKFFSMMAWYGATTQPYKFIISVTDSEGTSAGPETLSVTITEK